MNVIVECPKHMVVAKLELSEPRFSDIMVMEGIRNMNGEKGFAHRCTAG